MKRTIEEKQYQKRLAISILLALIINVAILLLLGLSDIKKPEKKASIITVRLQDKIIEEVKSMSGEEQQKLVKKVATNNKKEERKQQAKDKQAEIKADKKTKDEPVAISSPKEISVDKSVSSSKAVVTENNKTTNETINEIVDSKSIIEKKIEEIKSEQAQKELDFFKKTDNKNESDLSELDLILQGLISSKGSDQSKKGHSDGKDPLSNEKDQPIEDKKGDGINWGNDGVVRTIEYRTEITIPDEISKTGLVYSLKIGFSVNSEGFITSTKLIISTGNSILDNSILSQFRRWKFNRVSQGVDSNGEIVIKISY